MIVLVSALLATVGAMKERVIAEPAKQGMIKITYNQDRDRKGVSKVDNINFLVLLFPIKQVQITKLFC